MPTPELTTLLTPLADLTGQLSISRLTLDDALIALVARMPNLRVLSASHTNITQAHLAALTGLRSLELLTLTQSKLTDPAAADLIKLPALKKLYAWNSGLSAAALKPLADRGVQVDLGETAAAQPIETETVIKLSSDAPPVGTPAQAAAAGAAPAGLARPTNTTCPITGAAVNGDIVVVYKGKATAVCCEKCAAKVLAESIAKP